MSPDSYISGNKHFSQQPSVILLKIFLPALLMRVTSCWEAATLTANKHFIPHLWLGRKSEHLAKSVISPNFAQWNKQKKTHSCSEKQFNLLCTRLLQMTTPSTSGEEGAPTDPQVHWCQGAGAEGRLWARKLAYTKVFTQETGPKLNQILEYLINLLQISEFCLSG